jgi:16S rRNA (cytosine967-C5)-methyltransferase
VLSPTCCSFDSGSGLQQIPGLASRRAALKMLDAVFRRGQPLESALSAATQGLDNPADRSLARAIASETLRRIPDLDDLIDSATRNRLPDDAKARMVLRMGLVQALVLKTPEHAAVATSLPLVEGGPRRLVHGVLGTLMRQKAELSDPPSLPPAVAARWHEHWGDAVLTAASEALARPPAIDLMLKDAAEAPDLAEVLDGESLAPGHVRLAHGADVRELPGFETGRWWVQNISATIPARLLSTGQGRDVLDLCAAPGGKTMQLAANGWNVTAVDQDRARLVRLDDNLARTKLEAKVVCADLMRWAPPAPVQAILLDAPCSATGIFARHPDVIHRVRPKDIAMLAAQQTEMIARVAGWLIPDGTLIYATCSMEPEEGEAQIAHAEAAGLKIDPVCADELVAGIQPHPQGWVRILPRDGLDGFFIARLKRA